MADVQDKMEDLSVDDSQPTGDAVDPDAATFASKKKAEEAAAAEKRKKMSPKQIELFTAITEGDFATLKRCILEDGVPVNTNDEYDMSPLLQAAYKGNKEMCQFLLSQGSEVNKTCETNYYTPLMMAAVSGKREIVKLLLDSGANVSTVNSIGKTASDLAGFVGQHEISTLIKNYLTTDRLEPYSTPQGTNPARIDKDHARALQEIVMATNFHPVKVVITVNENPMLCNVQSLKKSCAVLDDLCRKCMRAKDDFDEVLALKLHYVSAVLLLCREHLEKNEDKKDLGALLKILLKENDDGVKIGCEQIIRKSLTTFPYTDLPLLQYLISTISPVKVGDRPTALSCIQSMFSGIQSVRNVDAWCSACGKRDAELRCGACKQNRYCTQRCQKLHWFVHKKSCKQKQQEAK